MIYRLYKIIALLLVLTTFQSCYEDSITETITEDSFTPFTIYESEISGLVSDASGNAIESALVSLGSKSTMTNRDGYYKLTDVSAQSSGALLTIESSGFLTSYRNIALSKSTSVALNITLNQLPQFQSFQSSQGGTLQISENASIEFNPNAIHKNGSPYSGNVLISTIHIGKDDPQLFQRTPGDLLGVDMEEETQFLETYGMVYVNMTDDEGNELQPANDIPARLSVSIPPNYTSQAPQTMPVWSLSELDGLWMEEGIARKVGNSYEADIPHFSWWNLDIPVGRLVNVCMVIKDEATEALIKNQNILISSSNIMFGLQRTNNNGEICVSLPADLTMKIQLADECSSSSTISIGPFTEAENVIEIALSIQENNEEVLIGGTLINCDDEILVLDYIILQRNDTRVNIPVANDGTYRHSILCPNTNDLVEIFAFDPISEKSYYGPGELEKDDQGVFFPISWNIKVCDNVSVVIAEFFGEDVTTEIESVVENPNETILVLPNNCYISYLGSGAGTYEGLYFCDGQSCKVTITIVELGSLTSGIIDGECGFGVFDLY